MGGKWVAQYLGFRFRSMSPYHCYLVGELLAAPLLFVLLPVFAAGLSLGGDCWGKVQGLNHSHYRAYLSSWLADDWHITWEFQIQSKAGHDEEDGQKRKGRLHIVFKPSRFNNEAVSLRWQLTTTS
jgi:hypothetical protein